MRDEQIQMAVAIVAMKVAPEYQTG